MPHNDDPMTGGQTSYDPGIDVGMTDHLLDQAGQLIDRVKSMPPARPALTPDSLSMETGGISDWAINGGGTIDGTPYFMDTSEASAAPPQTTPDPNTIKSDRYDPTLAGHQTILQTSDQDDAMKTVMRKVLPGGSTQFRLDANGTVSNVPATIIDTHSIRRDNKEEHLTIPVDGAPLGHTHSLDIVPGDKDDGFVIAGHPSNITYGGNVIVLEQNDGRYQARVLVDNTLTPSDRRNIQNELNIYQKRLQDGALQDVPPP